MEADRRIEAVDKSRAPHARASSRTSSPPARRNRRACRRCRASPWRAWPPGSRRTSPCRAPNAGRCGRRRAGSRRRAACGRAPAPGTGRAPHHIRHSRRAPGRRRSTSGRGRRSACRPCRARPQNPRARSRSIYQAEDLYSRQDGSWKSQSVMWSAESAGQVCLQPGERARLRRAPVACVSHGLRPRRGSAGRWSNAARRRRISSCRRGR